ncbi:MAG: molybdopterin molybdenumtransferase MoeA, partial [Proteobacteria bacterium]|nr:molybdopterin molybdenumtransferase MoeA [Pseudomonadota bacterium]
MQMNDGPVNRSRIPVDEAIVALLAQVEPVSDHERVLVQDAMGRTLVEDIPAPADVPPFDYATLDGYAVRASDTDGAAPDRPVSFEVVG